MTFKKPTYYKISKTKRKEVMQKLGKAKDYLDGINSSIENRIFLGSLCRKKPEWLDEMKILHARLQGLFEETERKIRQSIEEIEIMQLVDPEGSENERE